MFKLGDGRREERVLVSLDDPYQMLRLERVWYVEVFAFFLLGAWVPIRFMTFSTFFSEKYLTNNKINIGAQKRFISGMNGVMEHTLSVNAILQDARDNGLPLANTFVDLRNAFGSISHRLLKDMLSHVEKSIQLQCRHVHKSNNMFQNKSLDHQINAR